MIRQVTPLEASGSWSDRSRSAEWSADSVLERLSSQPSEALIPAATELDESTMAHVTKCVAQALPETRARVAKIQADLKRAGCHNPRAYQNLATVRYAGLLLSLIVFGTAAVLASSRAEPWCVSALAVGMFASWWLPVWLLQRRAARRMDEIEQAMPDLLDLVEVCLSQGLTIPSALATASRELRAIHPALAEELAIVCRQAELSSLEQALDNFERRIDLPAIWTFTSRLLQADETESKGSKV
jgi:tight adherence protein C